MNDQHFTHTDKKEQEEYCRLVEQSYGVKKCVQTVEEQIEWIKNHRNERGLK